MAIVKSLEQLFLLGAITDDSKLSDPIGHQMARLPLDPVYSKALILASQFNCLEEMLIAVAMLSVESIFYTPREKLEEVCAFWVAMCYCYAYHKFDTINTSRYSIGVLSALRHFVDNWFSQGHRAIRFDGIAKRAKKGLVLLWVDWIGYIFVLGLWVLVTNRCLDFRTLNYVGNFWNHLLLILLMVSFSWVFIILWSRGLLELLHLVDLFMLWND